MKCAESQRLSDSEFHADSPQQQNIDDHNCPVNNAEGSCSAAWQTADVDN